MAAVAGAIAEAVLAAMTNAAQLRRAYVNNGGDIALHLAPSQTYTIGMVERPETPSLFGSIEIFAATRIRGVATSGWRGRSFSLGIADAVTVLAETAAQADAAATVIANAVDLPSHPSIMRIPAREIAPDSDLLDLPVTRNVGSLSHSGDFSSTGRRRSRGRTTSRARPDLRRRPLPSKESSLDLGNSTVASSVGPTFRARPLSNIQSSPTGACHNA